MCEHLNSSGVIEFLSSYPPMSDDNATKSIERTTKRNQIIIDLFSHLKVFLFYLVDTVVVSIIIFQISESFGKYSLKFFYFYYFFFP